MLRHVAAVLVSLLALALACGPSSQAAPPAPVSVPSPPAGDAEPAHVDSEGPPTSAGVDPEVQRAREQLIARIDIAVTPDAASMGEAFGLMVAATPTECVLPAKQERVETLLARYPAIDRSLDAAMADWDDWRCPGPSETEAELARVRAEQRRAEARVQELAEAREDFLYDLQLAVGDWVVDCMELLDGMAEHHDGIIYVSESIDDAIELLIERNPAPSP